VTSTRARQPGAGLTRANVPGGHLNTPQWLPDIPKNDNLYSRVRENSAGVSNFSFLAGPLSAREILR
jgi:hypothetical protein